MDTIAATAKPAIGRGLRLQWEPAQNAHVLLYPEGMIKLNGSAGEIMKRCDGAAHASTKSPRIWSVPSPRAAWARTSRLSFDMALEKKWLRDTPVTAHAAPARPGPPLWLLCELTYRCPLHCVFCYNPVDFSRTGTELSTDGVAAGIARGARGGGCAARALGRRAAGAR